MSAVVASTTTPTDPPAPPPPARARLLGRFLVDEGLITDSDLEEALRLMSAVNVSLGDLAAEHGWITTAEAAALQRMQMRVDGRFGELAVHHGIGSLTPDRLEALRWEQQAHNLRLGDALVQLGAISATQMDRQGERFERMHAPGEFELVLPEPLHGIPSAYRAVELLPRLLRRLLAGPARLGRPAAFQPGRTFACACTTIAVPEPLQIGFTASCGVAMDIADALGSVLPRHHGGTNERQAVSHVVRLWAQQLLDPTGESQPAVSVEPGQMPIGGLEFELALAEGVATLVIDAVGH